MILPAGIGLFLYPAAACAVEFLPTRAAEVGGVRIGSAAVLAYDDDHPLPVSSYALERVSFSSSSNR